MRTTLAPTVPLVVVPVHVDGQGPYDFVFDIAVGRTVVSRALGDRLGIDVARTDEVTAAGGVMPVEVGAGVSIAVAGLGAAPREISLADLTPFAAFGLEVDGLLGVDFLRDFTIHVDPGAKTFTLDTRPLGEHPAALTFELAPAKPLALVPVLVNGVGPFSFGMDTGAGATILAPTTADRAEVVERRSTEAIGGGGTFDVQSGTARVRVGDLTREVEVGITPMDMLSAAVGAPLDGLLGQDLLGTVAMSIDYANRRLILA